MYLIVLWQKYHMVQTFDKGNVDKLALRKMTNKIIINETQINSTTYG